jgi:hypothetical protein
VRVMVLRLGYLICAFIEVTEKSRVCHRVRSIKKLNRKFEIGKLKSTNIFCSITLAITFRRLATFTI